MAVPNFLPMEPQPHGSLYDHQSSWQEEDAHVTLSEEHVPCVIVIEEGNPWQSPTSTSSRSSNGRSTISQRRRLPSTITMLETLLMLIICILVYTSCSGLGARTESAVPDRQKRMTPEFDRTSIAYSPSNPKLATTPAQIIGISEDTGRVASEEGVAGIRDNTEVVNGVRKLTLQLPGHDGDESGVHCSLNASYTRNDCAR